MASPNTARKNENRKQLPHVGQRITKTTIAVFLCLIIYYLRGYSGQNMPTESAITAIICMQPYVKDTRDYAWNRVSGTLIGAFWGLLFLLILLLLPRLGNNALVLYTLMAGGILVTLYSTVLIRKPDTASLAAIVFLCIVIAFPDIENPLRQAMDRMIDVFIGTIVAIGVNVAHLPRNKKENQIFFVRTKDLVPDRFSPMHSAALFRLNNLYDIGARICLMSEHAPAFFALQMSATRMNVPLIVMDGAAIYDINENEYLSAETITAEDSAHLRERMDALKLSYFTYTVHNNKTCIFHRGVLNEIEKPVYDRMRRSPYRDYLEGEIYDPNEIVYFKILAQDTEMAEIEYSLHKAMQKGKLRTVIRPQAGSPGVSGLYIYAHTATMEQAEKRLMQMLKEKEPNLEMVELRLRNGYQTDRDAMVLLTELGNRYAPVSIFPQKKKKPAVKEGSRQIIN